MINSKILEFSNKLTTSGNGFKQILNEIYGLRSLHDKFTYIDDKFGEFQSE